MGRDPILVPWMQSSFDGGGERRTPRRKKEGLWRESWRRIVRSRRRFRRWRKCGATITGDWIGLARDLSILPDTILFLAGEKGKEKGGEVVICCNWFFETSLRDFRFKRSVWSDFRDWTVAPLFGPLLFGSLSWGGKGI